VITTQPRPGYQKKGAIFPASFKQRKTSTLRTPLFFEGYVSLESDEPDYAPIEQLSLNQLFNARN
jgi:hypothetical protein